MLNFNFSKYNLGKIHYIYPTYGPNVKNHNPNYAKTNPMNAIKKYDVGID